MDMNFDNFDFDGEFNEEYFRDFVASVDTKKFYEHSSTNMMLSKKGKRQMTHSMLKYRKLEGTYFEWLPLELIEYIFEWERQLEIGNEINYFMKYYFTLEDTTISTIRHLRPTKRQRKMLNNGEVVLLDRIQIPYGDGDEYTYGRRIYKDNTASRVRNNFSRLTDDFYDMKDTCKWFDRQFKAITRDFMWVCHHSYMPSWRSFMSVIYKKHKDFLYSLDPKFNTYSSDSYFITEEHREKGKKKLEKHRFFLAHYLPYALLTHSDLFYDAVEEYVNPHHIWVVLYSIFEWMGVHPNNIDLRKAKEFEMELYAPKYYKKTYQGYMKLRSGRRVIPLGERPRFYWCGGKYYMRFE